MKEAIHNIVMENLDGKEYNGEDVMEWTRAISEQIKAKLRGTDTFLIRCAPLFISRSPPSVPDRNLSLNL